MTDSNYTDRARKVLRMAHDEAERLQSQHVGTEHILLAVIREGAGVAAAVLIELSVNFEGMQKAIEMSVKKREAAAEPDLELAQSLHARSALDLAMAEAVGLDDTFVGTEHLLLGLLREEKGTAAQLLSGVGVSVDAAREITRFLLGKAEA